MSASASARVASPRVLESSSVIEADSALKQRVLKNKLLFPPGKVLVVLPKGLRLFSVEEYVQHYGTSARPEYAFMDDSTASRYTISMTKSKLDPADLFAYRINMEKALEKSMTELIWFKREMIKLGDAEWAHLQMQNKTTDGAEVMSDFYVTSFGGSPLIFTVMTDSKQWYELRKTMQKMMLSVSMQLLPPTTSDKE